MVQNQQITMIKKLFSKEGFSSQGGELSAFDEVFSKDVKMHDVYGGETHGIENMKKKERAYIQAFPDKELTIKNLIAAEESIIVLWRARGTHKGDLPNMPATGNTFDIEGISIFQFSHGQVANIVLSWDRLGLLEQLGERQLAGIFQ